MPDKKDSIPRCSQCQQKAIAKLTWSPNRQVRYVCEDHWYELLDKTHAEYLAAFSG